MMLASCGEMAEAGPPVIAVPAPVAAEPARDDIPAPEADPVIEVAKAEAEDPFSAPALAADGPLDTPLACLARAVYFEARGLPPLELSAIAHVAINRRDSPNFPDTLCGVVKQGGAKGGCQFSWYCDGRTDVAKSEDEFAEATEAAWLALRGVTDDPTGGAISFHSARISPDWSSWARKIRRIGAHVFWGPKQRR